MEDFAFINEQFFAAKIGPERTDQLLAHGWRHFGEHYFRYNLGFYGSEIRRVFPLRIDLSEFSFSKSQRRVLNRNKDLETQFRPARISEETHELFHRHKRRFNQSVPESIYDFLSAEPASVPCEALECAIYEGNRLMAVSFFDIGLATISSIYGMFEPEETGRSLGILTMLRELQFALAAGKQYYYHGYIYDGSSFYDYKKRFRALEIYDWNGNWLRYSG